MFSALKEISNGLHNTLENKTTIVPEKKSKTSKDVIVQVLSMSIQEIKDFIIEDVYKLELEMFLKLNYESPLNRDILQIIFSYVGHDEIHTMDDGMAVKQLTWLFSSRLNIKEYQAQRSYSFDFLNQTIWIEFDKNTRQIDLMNRDDFVLSISYSKKFNKYSINCLSFD